MSKTILTITGSDGTGGSGIQADIRLISMMGGVAAFTRLVSYTFHQEVQDMMYGWEQMIITLGNTIGQCMSNRRNQAYFQYGVEWRIGIK